jgi:hypothetical protein
MLGKVMILMFLMPFPKILLLSLSLQLTERESQLIMLLVWSTFSKLTGLTCP